MFIKSLAQCQARSFGPTNSCYYEVLMARTHRAGVSLFTSSLKAEDAKPGAEFRALQTHPGPGRSWGWGMFMGMGSEGWPSG